MAQGPLKTSKFTPYQVLLIVAFVLLLFTIVVDYMTLPALSAILLPDLHISTEQFGLVVSAYAFSAGISGLLTTGFADRFDRKKLLLVYYGGFLTGMLLCATAGSFTALIIARIVSGAFGGVVASICFAITSDLFEVDQRGRVIGYIQMSFAASHVAGLPLAIYVATQLTWQFTYWLFFTLGLLVFIILLFRIKPIRTHLNPQREAPALKHLLGIFKNPNYWTVFLNNMLLVLGDVMFMTFSSAFSTNNLGIQLEDLPLLFGIGGVATFVFGPVWGRLTDRLGKLQIFCVGSGLAILMVGIYSHLGLSPFWLVVSLHTLLFLGINARMISSTALATIMPDKPDRGAFMALDASFQQLMGGIAATLAGFIVFQAPDGKIQGYPTLGWVIISVMLATVGLMYVISKVIKRRKN